MPRAARSAGCLATAALAVGLGVAGGSAAPPGSILVTVGEVTERSAVVWARVPGPGRVGLLISPVGGEPPDAELVAEAEPARDLTVKLHARDLAPATRHVYRVVWSDRAVSGEFVTAPRPDDARPVTLVWSGDLGGSGHCRHPADGYPVFRAMSDRRPDLFVFVGDTVYADQGCAAPPNLAGSEFRATTLDGFRRKARYNREDQPLQALFRGTSVLAVWDDHEVRNDFAGPTEPLMPPGRQAFLEYWPIVPPADEPTRLYRRFRWGRLLELFLLDTRQYRSPNSMDDGPAKTMLGAAQRAWLLAGVAGSDATWKAVVSSVSLSIPTGGAARDGWANGSTIEDPAGTPTGFEHELGAIVHALAAAGVRNLVWLVGDAHRAEVIRHAPLDGFVFHELVAGPLSARTRRPGLLDLTLRPTRLWGAGGFHNFGELTVVDSGLEVRILDAEGRVHFATRLVPEP